MTSATRAHEERQHAVHDRGIATFAGDDAPAGATAVLFTDATATDLLASPARRTPSPSPPTGASQADRRVQLRRAVGADVEVITGAALIAEEDQATGRDQLVVQHDHDGVRFVAVFVGAFIINNTFSITVAQRTREMAMLRAIGASGRQVKRSVLIEALVVGVIASVAGLGAGIGVATGSPC